MKLSERVQNLPIPDGYNKGDYKEMVQEQNQLAAEVCKLEDALEKIIGEAKRISCPHCARFIMLTKEGQLMMAQHDVEDLQKKADA